MHFLYEEEKNAQEMIFFRFYTSISSISIYVWTQIFKNIFAFKDTFKSQTIFCQKLLIKLNSVGQVYETLNDLIVHFY